ncbi:hypothetical protein [Mesoaciditoga lauensis]|uniref:hypothetical protein n=1 Tax=Mesoaciditoga lauensis TaxID=1495039 RepID=UPI0005647A85|nr:hypothetical protein [Mesoaciditoga lauensis]
MKNFFIFLLFHRRMNCRNLFSSTRRCQAHPVKISRVAAIQLKFHSFKSARDFYKHILDIVKKAKNKGAQLVCFPQGMNLEFRPLPLKDMNESQRKKFFEVYSNIFRDIAFNEKVYIEESKIRNGKFEGTIWTPQGEKVSGRVAKCGEESVYFSQFDSDFEEDINEKASLYLFPRFGHTAKKKSEISKAWLASQQNYVFSVESKLVGDYLNTKLRGRSGIYAPLEITEFNDGILAISDSLDEEEILVANLDFEALRELARSVTDDVYDRLLL